MSYPLKRSCQEASLLISERQDRTLAWSERLALALHLKVCVACPHFENQVDLMGRAMGRWRSDPDVTDREQAAPPEAPAPGSLPRR